MWSVETLCDSEKESPCTANPWTPHMIIAALRDPHVTPRAAFSLVVWPLAEAVRILTGRQSRAAWGKARKLRRGDSGALHPHRVCLPHSGAHSAACPHPAQPTSDLPTRAVSAFGPGCSHRTLTQPRCSDKAGFWVKP